MNVASLELCKELYELSGWESTSYYWQDDYYEDGSHLWNLYEDNTIRSGSTIPAYDLSYLMWNLPKSVQLTKRGDSNLRPGDKAWLIRKNFGSFTGKPRSWLNKFYIQAATPEDAACKLAIELFKAKILVRGNK